MGLKTFKGDFPVWNDVKIAKNYLDENELKILNNLVSGYFDLAEINAIEHKEMRMNDYIAMLDLVLTSGNRKLLVDSGKISHEKAIEKAKIEYKKYQAKLITPIEQAYLDTIKKLNDDLKNKK